MASCDTLISVLHMIVDTLPNTNDIPTMINLYNSVFKVLSIYINQCFIIYEIV